MGMRIADWKAFILQSAIRIPQFKGVSMWCFLIFVLLEVMMSPAEAQQGEPPFYRDKMRLLVYLDADGGEHVIAKAEGWPKRRAHILANMQLVMGPLPDRSRLEPLNVEVLETVELPSVVRKKVTFVSEPGDRAPAYLLVPKGLTGKAPAMLCLHQTTTVGKGEPAGVDGLPNLHYALELAQRGYVTLAPDYPHFGDYEVDAYAHGYGSVTMKGVWNHMRAVDLLASLPEVDAERIGCIGHSLGGHNTLFVGVFDSRLKVMVSSCGFNSFPRYFEGDLSGWSQRKYYMPRIAEVYGEDPKRMPFDFTEMLAALAPRAVFVNAPVKDSNFEVSGVRDCIDAAMPVYKLLGVKDRLVVVYPDAGHSFPPEVREAAYGFVEGVLGKGKVKSKK